MRVDCNMCRNWPHSYFFSLLTNDKTIIDIKLADHICLIMWQFYYPHSTRVVYSVIRPQINVLFFHVCYSRLPNLLVFGSPQSYSAIGKNPKRSSPLSINYFNTNRVPKCFKSLPVSQSNLVKIEVLVKYHTVWRG